MTSDRDPAVLQQPAGHLRPDPADGPADRPQKGAVDDFQTQPARGRQGARQGRQEPGVADRSPRKQLKTKKKSVQDKLAEARRLLANLTAKEKARLAAIEKKKAEEARRKAAELAEKQREAAAGQKQQEQAQQRRRPSGSGSSPAVRAALRRPPRAAPRRPRRSPSPSPSSASRTSGAPPAPAPSTAQGSPRPPGRPPVSRCRAHMGPGEGRHARLDLRPQAG